MLKSFDALDLYLHGLCIAMLADDWMIKYLHKCAGLYESVKKKMM